MNETPEAIRERIHSEELAKGSDPRVAEARAKAAEMRAKHGLPIDPQEAWKAKLEREGGAPSPAPAKPPEPEVAEDEPSESAAAPAAAPEVAVAVSEEPSPAQEEPSPASPATPSREPVVVPPPSEPEVPFDPEIGEILVVPPTVTEIGGVKVRDQKLPAWLMVILLAIPLWAILYLLALGGDDVARRTSECEVQPDRSFVCFLPEEETGGGPAGGH